MSTMNDAMQTITQGVYLIGVDDGEMKNLMTAAWVTQISSSPAILVAVGSTHYTAQMIRKAKHFSLSVLTPEQMEAADRCGKVSGRKENKLEGLPPLTFSEKGDPLLCGAAAHMDCQVFDIVETPDHILFCADVIRAEKFSDDVLIYREKDFF